MTSALIGHGGFVAANLELQAHFDEKVEARAAERLRGRTFDLLVCAGLEGRRRAGRDPEADRAATRRLIEALGSIAAARVVLLSTVEVFPRPEAVDEDAPIEPSSPYARHRRELELFCRERLSATVVRLPLAFGPGLSTGVVFDLLLGQETDRIHPDALLQHYPMAHLWSDVSLALERRIPELNLACEPIATRELALRCFGQELSAYPGSAPALCDVRSKFAPLWGGQPFGYLHSKARILRELAEFVERERAL
ncbi:MAG TPA: NAD-dependent epimerase/dehydratase family protein [Myxococcales bacterium]|nr:NAD-dependent epimerase/dehydratase family protein [Myxococcales bacterium]